MSDLHLRRKWTFRAHGQQVVLIKRPDEKSTHVLMKAFLWALYLPDFPALAVEVGIGLRYKPDVVGLDEAGEPVFWGESGQVGADKLETLLRRYRRTHFAFAKWETRLDPLVATVSAITQKARRTAPIDLFNFREDSAERFIAADGTIGIGHADVEWRRISSQ
ncbi:MAG TPA: hypothetical protein VD886_15820 [Herpetosiphonaceae bacterium]|nr:hypothetical protein [Herpetosiphonaceae bacterium]